MRVANVSRALRSRSPFVKRSYETRLASSVGEANISLVHRIAPVNLVLTQTAKIELMYGELLKMPAQEFQEQLPLRWRQRMPARVVMECEFAAYDR